MHGCFPARARIDWPVFVRRRRFYLLLPLHAATAYAAGNVGAFITLTTLPLSLSLSRSFSASNALPCDTGIVMTEISRDMGWFMRTGHALFAPVLGLFCKQPKAGAFTRWAEKTCRQLFPVLSGPSLSFLDFPDFCFVVGVRFLSG